MSKNIMEIICLNCNIADLKSVEKNYVIEKYKEFFKHKF